MYMMHNARLQHLVEFQIMEESKGIAGESLKLEMKLKDER